MALPIAPMVMPADLAGRTNGKLPAGLLTAVPGGGQLHHLAARAFEALVVNAWAQANMGLTYTFGGCYRTYAQQETLFRARYTPDGPGGGCKTWNGQRWCKKNSTLATAATPGTSNHGLGLAVDTAYDSDLADGVGPDDAAAVTAHPGWPWLLANAARFGFSWELQSEPWHIRYVTGDAIPAAVLQWEAFRDTPTSNDLEVDMIILDWGITTFSWNGIDLAWVSNGNVNSVVKRAKVTRIPVTNDELYGVIVSSRTTTAAPWTLTPELVAVWNGQAA